MQNSLEAAMKIMPKSVFMEGCYSASILMGCVGHDILQTKLKWALHPPLNYPNLKENQTKHPGNTGIAECSKILPHLPLEEVKTSGFTTVHTGGELRHTANNCACLIHFQNELQHIGGTG